ncbi:hypothetical protein GCM10010277_83230 [Streptomyces longisporoflavus]|nr:hypothetical protein GCM10010277_83230 [Streptomyces longisporoflavus]
MTFGVTETEFAALWARLCAHLSEDLARGSGLPQPEPVTAAYLTRALDRSGFASRGQPQMSVRIRERGATVAVGPLRFPVGRRALAAHRGRRPVRHPGGAVDLRLALLAAP